jgi:hypothetical protein
LIRKHVLDEIKKAVKANYLGYCETEYLAGWEAQEKGLEIHANATEMFRDGWADAYAAAEMIRG